MNKRMLAALGWALISTAGMVRAEKDITSIFEWRAALASGLSSGHLGRIELPDDVFDKCRRFPGDLRIIDDNGNQWPFYIWMPAEKCELSILSSHPLNQSIVEVPPRYLRLDINLASVGGNSPIHSRVIVLTSGQDFIRRVVVLGSEDQTIWAQLGEGFLINHTRDFKVDNRIVQYPPSTYPHLQIRVYPDARNTLETFSILRADAAAMAEQAGRWIELPLTEPEPASIDSKTGKQTLVYDLEAGNRPVEQVTIQARTPEYARALRVYGRNSPDGLWRWVADGEIHRFGSVRQDVISLKGFAFRYLKIELFNHDDLPLDIERVIAQATPRYLVFESLGGSHPFLYYGSLTADYPYYDLERRTQAKERETVPTVNLKDPQPNQSLSQPFWAKHKKLWTAIAVGLIGLIVLAVIVSMLKRMSDNESMSNE